MTSVISMDYPRSHDRSLQVTLMDQATLLRGRQRTRMERVWRPVNDLPSLTRPVAGEVADNMDVLLEEYHALVDLELAGTLPAAEVVRLRDVEAQLDELDANDPIEQAIDDRMRSMSGQLDAILEDLQKR